jgi:hypothetical protein
MMSESEPLAELADEIERLPASVSRRPGAASRVKLVPVALVSAQALYEIAYMTGAADRWRTRGRTVSVETFASMLMSSGDASFAIADAHREGTVVGYIGLYNVDETSMVGSISVFIDPRAPDAELVAGAAIHEFAWHVFAVIGLRKLMIESPASGSGYLERAITWSTVATKEGTLRAHSRLGPNYEDVDLFAVWGDAYLERYGTLRQNAVAETDLFTLVVRAIEDVIGKQIRGPSGGMTLVGDLGLDSLALLEVLDRLSLDEDLLLEVQDEIGALTIQTAVSALERSLG